MNEETNTTRLNYDLLFPSPTNPRRHFEEGPLKELSTNISKEGVIMPLLVRWVDTRQAYEIVAGERRFRALGMALAELASNNEEARYKELYEVPVVLRKLTDGQVLALQLIENLQRRDLTALEEAEGYQRLLDLRGDETFTPQSIADRIGRSVDTVLNKLKMLKAPKEMREALERGECSERHLILVSTIPGEDARVKCSKEILKGTRWDVPLPVSEALQLINEQYRRSLHRAPFALDDAALVPDAGACTGCPHFAKKAADMDADLAAELGNERGKLDPLTCLNPVCYRAKTNAVLVIKKEQAKAGEVTLLKKEEVQAIFNADNNADSTLAYRSGMVKLDAKLGYDVYGHYNEEKQVTWREATEGLLPVGSVKIARMKDDSLVELVEEKVARAAAKQHAKYGKLFAKAEKPELSQEQQRAKDRELLEKKINDRAKLVILDVLDERAATVGMDEESMTAVLDVALRNAGSDGCKLLATWLKLEVTAPKGEQLNQTHVRVGILEHLAARGTSKAELDRLVLMAILSNWVKIYGCDFDGLAPVEKRFGFDSKTVLALAKSHVQADEAAKKSKTKAKETPKKSTEQINAELKTAEILATGDAERAKSASREVVSVQEMADELGLNDEDHYFHCDGCGQVCATDEYAGDIAALPEGEFKCSHCGDSTRIGGHYFFPVDNQDAYEPWEPAVKPWNATKVEKKVKKAA